MDSNQLPPPTRTRTATTAAAAAANKDDDGDNCHSATTFRHHHHHLPPPLDTSTYTCFRGWLLLVFATTNHHHLPMQAYVYARFRGCLIILLNNIIFFIYSKPVATS